MQVIVFFMLCAFVGCKSNNTMTQKTSNEGTKQFVPQYTPFVRAFFSDACVE